MYGGESWTIKKTEHGRTGAFGLWCWRRFLRVPWTARRSNQSILKEICPEYSLEGLKLKPKLHTLATWCKELMLLNCGVGEDSWGPLDCKEIQPVHPKGNQSWIFIGRTDAEAETPIIWPLDAKNWLTGKNSDAGKDWRQAKKGTRGWDGLMPSLIWWTWIWASSGSWWWTGKPGVLQSMGSQRVRYDWATELSSVSPQRRPCWDRQFWG